MPSRSHNPIWLTLVSAVACVAQQAPAADINVVNHSFEEVSRALAIGEQTNGAGGAGVSVGTRFPFGNDAVDWSNPVEVPGWRTRLPPNGSPNIVYAGVLNPPDLGPGPFITGQDGENVIAIQVAQVGQTLDHVLQPNTRYTLDFRAGIGLFDSDYFFAVSLIAVDDLSTLPLENEPGVARLTLTQNLIPSPDTFGTMLPYTLEYTTSEVLPPNLIGRYVGIHMYGSDGIPRVVYDDFRLDATPIPEPVAIGLLMFSIVIVRRRDPSESNPHK